MHFKLHTVLSSVMKSQASRLRLFTDVNHPFVQRLSPRCICSLPVSHEAATSIINHVNCRRTAELMFQYPLLY